jgi:hypothetical protein
MIVWLLTTSNQQYIIDEGMAKATADALLLETYSNNTFFRQH